MALGKRIILPNAGSQATSATKKRGNAPPLFPLFKCEFGTFDSSRVWAIHELPILNKTFIKVQRNPFFFLPINVGTDASSVHMLLPVRGTGGT